MRYFYLISFLLLLPFLSLGEESEGLLNKLIAPGPLIEGHKNLENDCLKCHELKAGVPDLKCLSCHKEIHADVKRKHGFHGLNAGTCLSCHSEHKGRTFDSTFVDIKTFDHKKTGFSLEGKHSTIRCDECHTEKRTRKATRTHDIRFFGKKTDCKSCHQKDDIHFFKGPVAKKDCASCHTTTSWKEQISFSHAKDAHFELVGAHAKLKCQECHGKDLSTSKYVWKGLQTQKCLSCHNDYHKNTLSPKFKGGNCTTCHTQTSWKVASFDHKRVTGFELKGKHFQLQCIDCHKQKSQEKIHWTGLRTECRSCHKDPHFFPKRTIKSLGDINKCDTCHVETKWPEVRRFSHNQHTDYKLDGRHLGLKCSECHFDKKTQKPIYQWKGKDINRCDTCHPSPHTKTFSPELQKKLCTECHTTQGWRMIRGQSFDHNKNTRFALTGKHLPLKCDECHKRNGEQIYRFPGFEKKFCNDCHINVHAGQFSSRTNDWSCTECHTTDTFLKRLPFDHNRSHFKLHGKHVGVTCEKCHVPTNVNFKHPPGNRMHRFVFQNLGVQNCATCHKDPHKGGFGNRCMDCHNEQSWKSTSRFHQNFTLSGVHHSLACAQCHVDDRKLAGISQQCFTCHRKDDVHQQRLPNCQDCHGQFFWEQSRFQHSLTSFPLVGAHRTLDCVQCHRGGAYRALPSQCIDCHRVDATRVTFPPHTSPQFDNCNQCHNQFSF